MFWLEAYKWKPAANTGRECLCRGSLSLPEALESRSRASRCLHSGDQSLWRPVLGAPPTLGSACRATIKQRDRWQSNSERKPNHDREPRWRVATKHGLHRLHETCRPVCRQQVSSPAVPLATGSWWRGEEVIFQCCIRILNSSFSDRWRDWRNRLGMFLKTNSRLIKHRTYRWDSLICNIELLLSSLICFRCIVPFISSEF